MEFLLGKYESKNELIEVKEFKRVFFEIVNDFVPVLSGEHVDCVRLFSSMKGLAEQAGFMCETEVIEKGGLDKKRLVIHVTDNFKFEVVLVEHEEKGTYLFLEKCDVENVEFLRQDLKYLVELF